MPMQPPIAPAPKYMKDRVDASARRMDNVYKRRAGKKFDLVKNSVK